MPIETKFDDSDDDEFSCIEPGHRGSFMVADDGSINVYYMDVQFEYDTEEQFSEYWIETQKGVLEDITESSKNEMQRIMSLANKSQHLLAIATDSNTLTTKGRAVDIRAQVAAMKVAAHQAQQLMKDKQKELKSLVEAKISELQVFSKNLQAMVAKAEKAIFAINLYLGHDNECVTICSGEPASADELITIRQNVIFADEECGADARDGGIDVGSIDKFDEWMSNRSNMEKLLPEKKLIVGMHIRRYEKDYETKDYYTAMLNAANTDTSFILVRNGDNVYRITIPHDIGWRLFPTKHEFDGIFHKFGEVIKPGHPRYMDCMEESENKTKHYMMLLLVLQGLIDHEEILHPLPDEKIRINLCNYEDYDKYLRFIYEAENVIDDGRELWPKFRDRINSKLEVGCRVIGVFDYMSFRYDEGLTRTTPANAERPKTGELYTIEDKTVENHYSTKLDAFVIRYKRTEEVWDRMYGGYKLPSVRARCLLYKDDAFIVNYDEITEEECEYYLNSRRHRRSYSNMLPVLEKCLAMKKQEREDEAPFRLLLVSEIMKRYHADREDVEQDIDELITWWKLKNKTHRALLSDDSKALTEIVKRYSASDKQNKKLRVYRTHGIVDSVLTETHRDQTPVIVAHKKNNEFVALVPHDDGNVWVKEQTWKYNKNSDSVVMSDCKEWKTIDSRYKSWRILRKSERFEYWKINCNRNDYLTDDEASEVVKQTIKKLKEIRPKEMVLAATMTNNSKIKVSTIKRENKKPKIVSTIMRANFAIYETDVLNVSWRRENGELIAEGSWRYYCRTIYDPKKRPWEESEGRLIYNDEQSIAKALKLVDEQIELDALCDKYHDEYYYVVDEYENYIYQKDLEADKAEYVKKYGIEVGWTGEDVSRPRLFYDSIQYLMAYCAEFDVDPIGMSINDVMSEVLKKTNDKSVKETCKSIDERCLDMVIPPKNDKQLEVYDGDN